MGDGLESRRAHGLQRLRKARILLLRERRVALRHAEVGEDALHLHVRAAALPVAQNALQLLLAQHADAGHARVDLQMRLCAPAQPRGLGLEHIQRIRGVHRLGDVQRHGLPQGFHSRTTQDQDGRDHARVAQLRRLLHDGHREGVRTRAQHQPCRRDAAVSVGVGLHHAHQLHPCGNLRADRRGVVQKRRIRNLHNARTHHSTQLSFGIAPPKGPFPHDSSIISAFATNCNRKRGHRTL